MQVILERADPADFLQELESLFASLRHGHGDGVVERHHRRGQQAHQGLVEGHDLRPIGLLGALRLRVHGGDGCLDLVAARAAHGQGFLEDLPSFLDRLSIPLRTILVFQEDDFPAGRRPGQAPRVVQQHQRQKPQRLGLRGHQRNQDSRQTNGFGAKLPVD